MTDSVIEPLLPALLRDRNALEIGCYEGETAAQWARYARRVVTVDPFVGNAAAEQQEDPAVPADQNTLVTAHRALRDLPNVTILVGRSPEVLEGFKPGYFDVAYIDGQHTYEQCTADLLVCHGLLAPGSPVLCHDYGFGGTPDVKRSVDAAVEGGLYSIIWTTGTTILLVRL